MKFQFVLLLFLCGACFAGETVLWRLGEKDGKAQEFQLHYFPWEYGRAPYLRTNPDLAEAFAKMTPTIGTGREARS